MKKILAVIGVIIILLIAAGVSGYFYYDKNIRYGKPINPREISSSEGFHFENAISEKTMVFWNFNGNFHIEVGSFSSEKNALESFEKKLNTYSEMAGLNNGIFLRKEISKNHGFLVRFADGKNIIINVKKDNNVIQITTTNRSEEELEKFTKWFIWYQI